MLKKWGLLLFFLLLVAAACSEQDGTNAIKEAESDGAGPVETTEREESVEEKEESQNPDSQDKEEVSSSFDVSLPEVSAPDVSAPEVSAPKISAPEVTVTKDEEEQEVKMEVPDHLLFDFDSSTLRDDAVTLMEEISGELREYNDADIKILGHTDSEGDASYNKNLSERRAEAVKAFFEEQEEINSFYYTTKGFGEEQPLVPNDTKENREKNRRVEMIIQPK